MCLHPSLAGRTIQGAKLRTFAHPTKYFPYFLPFSESFMLIIGKKCRYLHYGSRPEPIPYDSRRIRGRHLPSFASMSNKGNHIPNDITNNDENNDEKTVYPCGLDACRGNNASAKAPRRLCHRVLQLGEPLRLHPRRREEG